MSLVRPHRGLQIPDFQSGMTYTIGERLGEGGFGWTFYCKNSFQEPLVAKVLKPRGLPKSQIRREWEQEADFLTMLRHPNIIHLYDSFEYGELYYFIMERARGSVRDRVRSHGPLSEREVVALGRQLLSGLHYIHSHRVIHRDIHTDNILYIEGARGLIPKISDFGISRLVHDSQEPRAFSHVGRAFEISPELLQLGYTSFQSDLYQVGLILYFCLTGEPALGPQDGEPEQAILSGVARERAKALGTPLGDCVAIFLRRQSKYRFQSAIDAWEQLRSSRSRG